MNHSVTFRLVTVLHHESDNNLVIEHHKALAASVRDPTLACIPLSKANDVALYCGIYVEY